MSEAENPVTVARSGFMTQLSDRRKDPDFAAFEEILKAQLLGKTVSGDQLARAIVHAVVFLEQRIVASVFSVAKEMVG